MNNYTLKRVHTSPAIFQQFDSEGNTMGFRSDDERVVEILKNSQKMRLEEIVKSIEEREV